MYPFKVPLVLIVITLLVPGCRRPAYSPRLVKADSLLAASQDLTALQVLRDVQPDELSPADRAYYALLLTQAEYKNYIDAPSDSLINQAVDYYSQTHDREKWMRALLYQGCVNEGIGNLEKAASCYHRVEKMAEPDDCANRAYAKLRLAFVYQNQVTGSTTIARQKFEEAMLLYRSLGNQHYELMCLSEIGNIYRNIENKHDSAVVILNEAIGLARRLNERYSEFANLLALSEFYSVRKHDYRMAKELALAAIDAGGDEIDHPRAHYRLAMAYSHLGQADSAQRYAQLAPPAHTVIDSIVYCDMMSDMERKSGNLPRSYQFSEKAHRLSDSVLMAGLSERLLAVERRYDTQQLELDNERLHSRWLRVMLILAASGIIALILGRLVVHYRWMLRKREQEYLDVKSQLDDSLASLHELSIDSQMQAKGNTAQELTHVIQQQIRVVEQLMTWANTMQPEQFMSKFYSVMTLPADMEHASYWNSLHSLANALHDNLLTRARQIAGNKLRDDEINFLALYSIGFSTSVIMVCMRYKNVGTVYNKQSELAHKLHVRRLRDFVKQW